MPNKTIDIKALQDKISWHPHPGQQQVIDAYLQGKTKIVVASSQRWGKSMVAAFLVCLELLADDRSVLIIAPSYSLCDRVFEYVRKWLSDFFNQPVNYISKPYPQIKMPWGSYCVGASGEAEVQLLGRSWNFWVSDESSRIPRAIFEQYLFPRLGEKQGKCLMIGTPWKKDHFFEYFMQAKQDNSGFQFNIHSNPYYPKSSVEAIQKQLPAAIFQREFLGIFTDELTSIFPNTRELINPKLPRAAQQGEFFYCGLDLGQVEDYTALVIVSEQTNEVVFCERWNQLPYLTQLSKILGIISRYRPCRVVIDSRNVGVIISEGLRQEGVAVEDFIATGTVSKDWQKRGSKERLVEKTISIFESHSISIPDNADLLDELSAFSYNISPLGNVRFSAPSGMHDDLVFALMLACWNLNIKTRESEQMKREQEFKIKKYQQDYEQHQKNNMFYPELGF